MLHVLICFPPNNYIHNETPETHPQRNGNIVFKLMLTLNGPLDLNTLVLFLPPFLLFAGYVVQNRYGNKLEQNCFIINYVTRVRLCSDVQCATIPGTIVDEFVIHQNSFNGSKTSLGWEDALIYCAGQYVVQW